MLWTVTQANSIQGCCSCNSGTQTPHSYIHCTLPVLPHVNFMHSIHVWRSVANIQLCCYAALFRSLQFVSCDAGTEPTIDKSRTLL